MSKYQTARYWEIQVRSTQYSMLQARELYFLGITDLEKYAHSRTVYLRYNRMARSRWQEEIEKDCPYRAPGILTLDFRPFGKAVRQLAKGFETMQRNAELMAAVRLAKSRALTPALPPGRIPPSVWAGLTWQERADILRLEARNSNPANWNGYMAYPTASEYIEAEAANG